MTDFNHTDALILKLYRKGLTLERIAARIGRPGNIERVQDGLRRNSVFIPEGDTDNVLPT